MDGSDRRSWRGSGQLKGDVLRQLRAQHRAAQLAPITVDGRPIPLHGWATGQDLPRLSASLAIPVDLLSIGLHLWDGFPEDPAGVRDLVDARCELLEAIPVGADLSEVTTELVARFLADERVGVRAMTDDPRARALLETVALALLSHEVGAHLTGVATELATWRAALAEPRSREPGAAERLHRHVRALETAQRACRFARDDVAAYELIQGALYGGRGTDVQLARSAEAACRDRLLALLGAAGGW